MGKVNLKNKSFIFIVGKTSSGKDTIARYITSKYGIKPICSYTTRPKRENETDGVEHYFISAFEMNRIRENESVLAYVKFHNGVEYCSTIQGMTDDRMLYIIDPDGIEYFRSLYDSIKYKIIYVDLEEDIIRERALNRGDDSNVLNKRILAECTIFDNFKNSGSYDYIINTNKDKEAVFKEVDAIMEEIV